MSHWCLVLGVALLAVPTSFVHAETISSALARAYLNNPDLNSQRAAVRAADEGIPLAKAAGRPTVGAALSAEAQDNRTKIQSALPFTHTTTFPRTVGVTVNQTLWNGNRIGNGISQAESKMLAARETMRNDEQVVLLNGATQYMNVLRDSAILNLDSNNIKVLQQQLRQTSDQFKVGQLTETDVAQAQSSLAQARTTFFVAQGNLEADIANYRAVIGTQPRKLAPAKPLLRLVPHTLGQAIALSQAENPLIQALLHGVDAAALQVKIAEGALYPTVSIAGSLSHSWDFQTFPGSQANTASVIGQLTVPIYDGGTAEASTRGAKETLAQQRLQVDLQRVNVRAAVITAWGQVTSSREAIVSSLAAERAAETALRGVREEAKVGQRTTLDVLNAQQVLLNARVALVSAQHDYVVATYSLVAATGRLSAANLQLHAPIYDANVHYRQVKDKWIGLRTPDGR